MHVQSVRNLEQAESNLMSQHHSGLRNLEPWSNDSFEHGIIDLYARRMEVVAYQRETARQESLDRLIITQPFGRPFTAQPSPPAEPEPAPRGLAELRKRFAGAHRGPRRRLATS